MKPTRSFITTLLNAGAGIARLRSSCGCSMQSSHISSALARGRCGARGFSTSCNISSDEASGNMSLSPHSHLQILQFLSQAPSNALAHRALSDLRSNHAGKLPPSPPSLLNRDLTCDAGEWGAVKIYEGAEWAADLRLSFDADARGLSDCIVFLRRHRESESEHLALMSQLLQPAQRTRLLTMWSCAGLLLGEAPARGFSLCKTVTLCCASGALPMLVGGPVALYRTVVHVETFVEQHYTQQLQWMHPAATALAETRDGAALHAMARAFAACSSDESLHLQEAAAASEAPASAWQRSSLRALIDGAWRAVVGAGSAAAVAASRVV
jgi:demethoxyubiquinone hydroxylase (CLK1/Coq7/Cat5 family)